MITKQKLKQFALYKYQKYRDIDQVFVVEGVKLVEELLESQFAIEAICCLKGWKLNKKSLPKCQFFEISEEDLKKISNFSTPNQVWALVKMPTKELKINFDEFTIILDDIKDPGNLGTIIRIADWFGIKNVICSEQSVAVCNPKVVQASMGSIFRISIFYKNLKELISSFPKDYPIYGTLLEGENLYQTSIKKRGAIVIGSESHGISEEIKQLITNRITIPRFGEKVESLNASIATAIVISEIVRQNA